MFTRIRTKWQDILHYYSYKNGVISSEFKLPKDLQVY